MKRQMAQFAVAAVVLIAGWRYARQVEYFCRGVEADLYPSWYAAQQVFIEHRSPYSEDAARAIQRGIYGRTVEEGGTPMRDEQRFAYPLFALFAMAPLALVSFASAQTVAFWLCVALSLATTWLWSKVMGVRCNFAVCALALAAFPVALGIVLRQPTVLYLFLLALAAYAAKSERYILAGTALGIAAAKPQLALAVMLPLCCWMISDWPHRKRIALAFTATLALLIAAATALQPAWLGEWLHTLAAYRTYANSGSPLGYAAGVVVVLLLVFLWRKRHDLDFALALATAGVYCLIPFQSYNEALLLPAMLWIWRERKVLAVQRFARLAYWLTVFMFSASMVSMLLVWVLPASPVLFELPWRLFIALGALPLPLLVIHRFSFPVHAVAPLTAERTEV
jgi:hypothetical protein